MYGCLNRRLEILYHRKSIVDSFLMTCACVENEKNQSFSVKCGAIVDRNISCSIDFSLDIDRDKDKCARDELSKDLV